MTEREQIRRLRHKRDVAYGAANIKLVELITKARSSESMESLAEAMGMSRQGLYYFLARTRR